MKKRKIRHGIQGFAADAYLTDGDLLYHPVLRRKIYAGIGEDPDTSYCELARQKGFDLACEFASRPVRALRWLPHRP